MANSDKIQSNASGDKASAGEGAQIEGEGSYSGAKQYNEATRRFVEEGKVEQAAAEAAPESPAEAREMEAAEQVGKRKAKGEDPALQGGADESSEVDDDDVE